MRALVIAFLAISSFLPAQNTGRCFCGMGLQGAETHRIGTQVKWFVGVARPGCPFSTRVDRVVAILGAEPMQHRLTWSRYVYCDLLVRPDVTLFLTAEPRQSTSAAGQFVHGPYLRNDPSLIGQVYFTQLLAYQDWGVLGFTNARKTTVIR